MTGTPPTQNAAPHGVPFMHAVWFWLKLGCVSFGGPAGQIALMHQELVERRRWLSERRFMHALHYCMLLPGPEAQQLATYIGWLMHKRWGGVVAGSLFVLPSLVILIVLSWLYMAFHQTLWMSGLFYGIQAAVVAIVLHAAYRIGSRILKNIWLWGVALASFVALFAFALPFPVIVATAALVGVVGARMSPHSFHTQSTHHTTAANPAGSSVEPHLSAWLDDHSPAPAHTRFAWRGFFLVLLSGVVLWAVPLGLLAATWGWQHDFTQMAWFFTKAALLTFGGAYAVLPYVYQGAVLHYAWVTPSQMMDGLALGETTPGPLIMVVAFVGFVGGYAHSLLGTSHALASGVLAACLVTWFTFLPSFIFILAGGPLVESTHNNLNLTAPLSAITAAVVGVVVNLALFFAQHVLWPQGFSGGLDLPALALSMAALLALQRFKRSVMEVLLACGLIGLSLKALSS